MKSCLTILFVLVGLVLKAQVVDRELKNSGSLQLPPADTIDTRYTHDAAEIKPSKIVFIVNGKRISEDSINKIDQSLITSISVIKPPMSRRKYGRKARDGAIIVTTKPS